MKSTILKTIAITAICLLSMTSHGQTKEETINWLKEKLTAGLYLPQSYNNQLKFVSINECEFVVSFNNPQKDGSSSFHLYTIPTTNITINEGKIESKLDVIKHYMSWNASTNFQKSVYEIEIRESETDIYTRIQKALDHLSTFCPKKKETF